MKKSSVLLACCFIIVGELAAQTEEEKWNVGIHGGSTQYSGDLGQGFYSTRQAFYGFLGVSLSRYLTNRLDATLMVTKGQVGYLTSRGYLQDLATSYNFEAGLSTANLALRYNLRDRESLFVPYVFAGGSVIRQRNSLTGVLHKKLFEFAVPTGGIGFNLRINPTIAFQFQEMFMYTMSDDIDGRVGGYNDAYLFHTAGITFNLGKYHRVEGSRAGNKIDRCSDMRTGFRKKYTSSPRKTKDKKRR